ncbi:hypothetical protein [Chryseobacterium sp. T16E-39]|uniref:hypothetical protein n=1 Tax=Chryseobacterium sp. T16E-39 TaxID=2015076 RepID=UPI001E636C62|nr:hypothetical protein [Chryseobacterium sp. T16E-39]
MKINMYTFRILYCIPVFLLFFISCEKEYKSPNYYKKDLFEDERHEGEAYIMNKKECIDGSDMVLVSSDIKLVDSSSGRGRSIFIYRLKSGMTEKTTRDSVVTYPLQFLSNQRLKLKKDSMYIFLKKLNGYRFIAEEKKLKYQWLKSAPVYTVGTESK